MPPYRTIPSNEEPAKLGLYLTQALTAIEVGSLLSLLKLVAGQKKLTLKLSKQYLWLMNHKNYHRILLKMG